MDFWNTRNFYGVDLSPLHKPALKEKLSQAIIDTYDPKKNLSAVEDRYTFDFKKCTLKDLQYIDFNFKHQIRTPGLIHGYACWFVAYFRGTTEDIELSTSPDKPCTHWYQMRLLLLDPLGVNRD